MKSKLLQFGRGSKELFNDINTLAELPIDSFKKLIHHLDKLPSLESFPTDDELLPITKTTDTTIDTLMKAFRAAYFLFDRDKNKKDKLEDILYDLIEIGKIKKEHAQSIKDKIDLSKNFFNDKIEVYAETIGGIANTFPTLDHIHIRCSTITKFDPEYNIRKDDPSKYATAVKKIFPVLLIQIDVDKYNDIERFSFAITKKELDELITRLQLAKAQVEELDKFLSRG